MGVVGVAALLPKTWTKPVVDGVILPAHAQTSQTIITNVDSISVFAGSGFTLNVLENDIGLDLILVGVSSENQAPNFNGSNEGLNVTSFTETGEVNADALLPPAVYEIDYTVEDRNGVQEVGVIEVTVM